MSSTLAERRVGPRGLRPSSGFGKRLFAVVVAAVTAVGGLAMARGATVAADAAAVLGLSKSSTNPTPQAGTQFDWVISYKCASPNEPCVDAVVTDTIPAPLEIITTIANPEVTGTSNFTSSWSGNSLTVTFTQPVNNFTGQGLAAGVSGTITVHTRVPSTLTPDHDGDLLTNTADFTASNADPVNASAFVHLVVPPVTKVTTSKSFSPSSALAQAGTTTTLTIGATNTSNVPATEIVITDPTSGVGPFNELDFSALQSCTPTATVEAYNGSAWAPLAGVTAADVVGLRVTFAGPIAIGASVTCQFTLAQRSAPRDNPSGSFVGGATANNTLTTDLTTDTGAATAQATATYTMNPLAVHVAAAKSFTPTSVVNGGSSTVTISGTNTSGSMVDTLVVTEPGSGSFLDATNMVFGGFTGGITWPSGATSGTITWIVGGTAGSPVVFANGATPVAPSGTITGFILTYTGIIADAAVAAASFTVDVGANANPSSTGAATFANTVGVTGHNPAGDADASATANLSVLKRVLLIDANKTFSPTEMVAYPGKRTVATLTATPTGSTVNPTDVVINDPEDPSTGPTAFGNRFDTRAAIIPVPANTTLTITVYKGTTPTSFTVPGLPSASATTYTADFATLFPDYHDITGVSFAFHNAAGFTPSTTLQASVTYAVRATTRDNTPGNPGAGNNLPLVNCTKATDTDGTLSAHDSACADFTLKGYDGSGVGIAHKDWDDPDAVTEHSQGQIGATLYWGTAVTGVDHLVVSDSAGSPTPVSSTVFDAFDLVSIQPITTATDPLIKYDQVTKVELFDGSSWVDITSAACPGVTCQGAFPGYTLTAAERASTIGVRLTFAEYVGGRSVADPNSPDVGSGVASSPPDSPPGSPPGRPLHLTFQLRDTKRSDATQVLATATYNHTVCTPACTLSPGVVDNTMSSTLYDSNNGVLGSASWTDHVVIVPATLGPRGTKAWNPTPVSLPPDGSPASSFPTSTLTITGQNYTPVKVDSLTIEDPTGATNPFDSVNIEHIAITMPTGATGANVALTYATGHVPAPSDCTSCTISAAGALSTPQLADVVGIKVTFTGRIEPTSNGTIILNTRVRPTLRSDSSAKVGPGTVPNTATVTVAADGIGNASTDVSAPLTIEQGTAGITGGKSFNPTSALQAQPGTAVTATLVATPSGNYDKTEVVMTDQTPTSWNAFDLTGISLVNPPGGADLVQVDYRTDTFAAAGSSITVTKGAGSDATGWYIGIPTAVGALPMSLTSLIPVSLDTVTGVRFTFTKTSGTIINSPARVDLQLATRQDLRTGGLVPSTADQPAPGETVAGQITNTLQVSGTDITGAQLTGPDSTALFTVSPGTAAVAVAKQGPGQVYPGNIESFTLTFKNTGTGLLYDPVFTDTLPAELLYQPAAVIGYHSSLGASGLPTTPTVDYTAPVISFSFPAGTVMKPGEIYTIVLPLQVQPGLIPGLTVRNVTGVSSSTQLSAAACSNLPNLTSNPSTFDATTNTCSTYVDMVSLKYGGFTSFKEVKSSLDEGAVNTSVGGGTCTPTTDGFYRLPCAAMSGIETTETWRLNVTNGGNQPATQLVLVDVLPHPGDTGVVATGVSRGSEWRPVFTGGVALTTDTLSAGTTMTVYYSTSDTPCTADLDVDPAATPCAAAAWTPYIEGTTDPTIVKSLKYVFDFSALTGGMLPAGAQLEINYTSTNEPKTATRTDGAPIDQTVDGAERAWNSFGLGGSFMDGLQVRYLLPAEPLKAGIALATGPIGLHKIVAGASQYAPTSFTVTAACTIGADHVVVPLTTSTFTLDAANSYTARIDGLPVGAVCTMTESGTAPSGGSPGSYGETTRTYTPSSVTVIEGASTAPVPAGSVLSVTNTYTSVKLTVTKSVVSDSTVGTFGPFEVTVSCTIGTTPVTLSGATFTISDGGSKEVTGIPVGATCTVTETDTAGASSTTVAVNGGAPLTATSTDVTLTQDATVAFVNTFDTGTLALNKAVLGTGASLYGGGTFTAHVTCVLGTTTLTDSDYTITGGQTVTLTDKYPVGTVCTVTEPKTGGASSTSIATGTVTIVKGLTTAQLTNTFDTGTLDVSKVRTGPGASLYGAGPFTVEVSCTYLVDGVSTAVLNASPATVVLNAANGYASPVMVGSTTLLLPVGATCVVAETKTGGAGSTTISPNNGTVTIGKDQAVTVTVTNDFPTGDLKVVKVRTGNGVSIFGAGPFTASVSCTWMVDGVSTPVPGASPMSVTLSAGNNYAVTVGGLPVGATCTVAETDDGGATSSSLSPSDGKVTIAASTAPAVQVTVTNDFQVGDLKVNKARTGAGADAYGAGPFTVSVVCTYRGATFDLGTRSVQSLNSGNAYSATVTGIPLGATCTVTETGTGGATSMSVTPNDGVHSTVGVVTVSSATVPAVVTVTNVFDLGTIHVVKVRTGAGAGNAPGPFTVVITCLPDLNPDSQPFASATVVLSAANNYQADAGNLPVGAICTVKETVNGGASSVSISPNRGDPTTGFVGVYASPNTATVTVTNNFDDTTTTTTAPPTTTTIPGQVTTTTAVDSQFPSTTVPSEPTTTIISSLPVSGSNSGSTLTVAALMMAAGAVLMMSVRRRNKHTM